MVVNGDDVDKILGRKSSPDQKVKLEMGEDWIKREEEEVTETSWDWSESEFKCWANEERQSVNKMEIESNDEDGYESFSDDDEASDKDTSINEAIDHTALTGVSKCKTKIEEGQEVNQDLSTLLGDMCQFSCFWCQHVDSSYHRFCQHVMQCHHASVPSSLLKDDAETYATKLVLTCCKICKLALAHDSYCIVQHLIAKHMDSKRSVANIIKKYLAMPKTGANENKNQESTDFERMQKCFVVMKLSKYAQYFKDSLNRKSVECVERKDLDHTYALKRVCFLGKKLPVEATFEIGDLCLFMCSKCQKKFQNMGKMVAHEKNCVGPRKSHDTTRIIHAYLAEARYHRCRLCNIVTLCDIKVIQKHLKFIHRLKLTQYMFKIPKQTISCKMVSRQEFNFKNSVLNSIEKEFVPESSVTTAVCNMCSFKCDKCKMIFDSFNKLSPHIKKCKDSGGFQWKYVMKAAFHDCKICDFRMICDVAVIRRHLYTKHEMKVQHYEALPAIVVSSQRSKNTGQKRFNKHAIVCESHERHLVPKVPPFNKKTNPAGSLPDHLTTDKIGNFCLFACDLCDFQTFAMGGMQNHTRNAKHGPGHAQFDKKYLKEARYHKCTICGLIILCDTYVIDLHAKTVHGYNLNEYQGLSSRMNHIETSPSNQTEKLDMASQKGVLPPFKRNFTFAAFMISDEEGEKVPKHLISTQVLNLSTFRCDKCNKTFSSWLHTAGHLKKCKKSKGPTYFHNKYLLSCVVHECKVCGRKMLCDKTAIGNHIYHKHGLNFRTYSALNEKVDKSSSKLMKISVEGTEKAESIKTFQKSLSQNCHSFVLLKHYLKDEDMTSHLGNFCKFQCLQCQFSVKSWTDLSSHLLQSGHSSNKQVYFHRDYLQEAVYHKCRICGKGVLCDKELFRHHLKGSHRLALLSEYREFRASKNTKSPDFKTTQVTYEKNYLNLPPCVTEDMKLSKVVNGCIFMCDKCPCAKNSWQQFRVHKLKVHGDVRFKFEPKYVKKASYYKCPFCKAYILCDKAIVLSHLNRHKFRKLIDFEKWMKEHGHTAPSNGNV